MRVTAYGTVDELNATLGLARLHADDALGAQLSTIQNDLFDLGADLCTPNMERDADREYPAAAHRRVAGGAWSARSTR
jgi:cob(I)alamin adenosyltransferase